MCILFITLQNGSCYNSFSVGFSQNHYHWTPETTAPVWLSSDHHCQWYLYQELSLLICCKTYSYMRYLLCEMVFFLSCIFFKKQCNLLWVFWVSLIWMIFSFQYPHIWRLCQWLPAPNYCTYWRSDFILYMLI